MKRIITAAAAAAVIAVPGAAHAASTTQIRQGDLTTVAGISSNGVNGNAGYQFRGDGVSINVDSDSDGSYVVLRWPVAQPLASIHKVDFNWVGTTGKPGIKYDVDGDGDGTIDCVLQGELGDSAVRLNNDSDQITGSNQHSDPNYCESHAPDPAGTLTGYPDDGTLDDWAKKFGPTSSVINGGISASGVVQSGVLYSVNFGAVTDTFTNQAATQVAGPAVADVTGSRSVREARHAIGFVFSSDAQRAGTSQGRALTWSVTVNGHKRFSVTQNAGARASYRFVNHNTRHRKVVRLYKNGAQVGRYLVGKA